MLSPFRPVQATLRSEQLTLKTCFIIQLTWWFVTAGYFLVLFAWSRSPYDSNLGDIINQLQAMILGFLLLISTDAAQLAWALAGFVGSVTAMAFFTLLSAWLLMPWCATDEKLVTSFLRSLRRIWLCTPHVLLIPLCFATCELYLNRLSMNYYDHFEQADWQITVPWLVRNRDMIYVILNYLCFGWVLFIVLHSVSRPATRARCRWPARCETCGYQLTGLPYTATCPECGLPISESIGKHIRPGTVWSRQHKYTRPSAWWRCTVDPVIHPKQFGRQLRLLTDNRDHYHYLIINIGLLFGITLAGATLMSLLDVLCNQYSRIDWDETFIISVTIWYMTVTLLVGSISFTSSCYCRMGVSGRRRNMMPAAIQAQCYLSGYVLGWMALNWILAALMYLAVEYELLSAADLHRYNLGEEDVIMLLFFSVNFILWLIMQIVSDRIIRSAFHANR